MKNVLITLLALCALGGLSGCAEKMYAVKGAEALVYPESHTYRFTLNDAKTTNVSPQDAEEKMAAQLAAIIAQAQQRDHQFTVAYLYSSQSGKRLAQQQIQQLRRQGVSPTQYRLGYLPQPDGDLTVTVQLHRVITEVCQPEIMGQPIQRRDCFVDTMRMKQVANPQRLIEK